LDFNTPAHMLRRNDAPDTSHESAILVDTNKLEKLVYDTIKSFGIEGCILDQIIAANPMIPYPSITARPSALTRKDLIYDTGKRKLSARGRNQRVMAASCFRPPQQEFIW
jgi:hypothetical protein